jgi:hypothetical protein
LWELSHKWRIPKSTNLKAWEELRGIVASSRPCREDFVRRRGEFLLRDIERQVAACSSRKSSKKREVVLKDLEKKRSRVLRLYFSRGSGAGT